MLRKKLFLSSFIFVILALVGVALSLRTKRISAQTTPPVNFKVAFIGDSGAGSGFQNVLNLIKAEGADMVLHQGDFSYDGTSTWINRVDSTLGSNFPYLGSVGNHDAARWGDIRSGCSNSTWAGYFKCKMQKIGITPELGSHNQLYAVNYKGLRIVFVNESPGSTGANWVNQKLSGDSHIWKICSWHKNQRAMQVGGKGDGVGWEAYENCRKQGAIIATAHEHSYQRTKTLTSTTNQTVDSSCSGRNNLCVAPGKTFVFVSGNGGQGLRNQERCLPTTYPYGCKGEWASIYTTNQGTKHGALFIEFNYGGNPNRAHGYFKNVNGQVIDDFFITKGGSAPTGGATSTPIPTNSPTPKASPTPFPGLSFEAEDGVITSPFTVTSGYVSQPIESSLTTGGRASYRFNITDQGDYLVKAVVNASSTGSDSFFVNIDGEPVSPEMIWDIGVTGGFEERTVSWRGNGTPDVSEFNPKVFALTSGKHELVIRGREQDTRIDKISIVKTVYPTPTTPPIQRNAFRGKYYDGKNFNTLKHSRVDDVIDFDWGLGSPAPGVGVDSFSVRWEGDWDISQGGTYRFTSENDDGIRVWVDGQKIIDDWNSHPLTVNTADVNLSAGTHRIKVEYFEDHSGAIVRLSWALTSSSLPGDLDGDNDVDIFDYNTLVSNFGATNCGNKADIDPPAGGDCDVDIFDYNLLVGNFGK